MIITAIRTLLSQAFDAASYLFNPVADEAWERACRHASSTKPPSTTPKP